MGPTSSSSKKAIGTLKPKHEDLEAARVIGFLLILIHLVRGRDWTTTREEARKGAYRPLRPRPSANLGLAVDPLRCSTRLPGRESSLPLG